MSLPGDWLVQFRLLAASPERADMDWTKMQEPWTEPWNSTRSAIEVMAVCLVKLERGIHPARQILKHAVETLR